MKIHPEVEVPEGEYCDTPSQTNCSLLYKEGERCRLFEAEIFHNADIYLKCHACLAACEKERGK